MRSLDGGRSRALFGKELREVFRARTFWALWLILAPLVGYGFIQAVRLYAEASRTALKFPDMARGLSPLDGVLVPTFGAYYLAATFLWPFLVLRSLSEEKRSGWIKLLLQTPLRPWEIVAGKVAALGAAGVLSVVPGLSALMIWRGLGGHIHGSETMNLLLGYGLYAWAVTGISLFAAAATESASTASVVALALVLGSWVMDFAGGSFLSLTAALRPFERGLFSLSDAGRLFLTGLGGVALAALWLAPARPARRLVTASVALLGLFALGGLAGRARFFRDVSEDRRNSLNPADERALRGLDGPLTITVHLSPEDSRLKDMERNLLGKLRRLVPRLTVVYAADAAAGPLGASTGDEYGWIVYGYGGKTARSTSNSDEEVLPIIYSLAGAAVTAEPEEDHPGRPLAADAGAWGVWFYGALPLAGVFAAVLAGRRKKEVVL